MTTAKHTPVQLHGKGFRKDFKNGGEFVPLLGPQGEWLADILDNGDFHRFVVTALNAHDDLLAVAKRVANGGMSYPKHDRDLAVAAIAKAEPPTRPTDSEARA